MSQFSSYYAALGVPSTVTPAEITTAYRKAALKYHPDKASQQSGPDTDAATAHSAFVAIGAAYEVLSDEGLRALYDKFVARGAYKQGEFSTPRARDDWSPEVSPTSPEFAGERDEFGHPIFEEQEEDEEEAEAALPSRKKVLEKLEAGVMMCEHLEYEFAEFCALLRPRLAKKTSVWKDVDRFGRVIEEKKENLGKLKGLLEGVEKGDWVDDSHCRFIAKMIDVLIEQLGPVKTRMEDMRRDLDRDIRMMEREKQRKGTGTGTGKDNDEKTKSMGGKAGIGKKLRNKLAQWFHAEENRAKKHQGSFSNHFWVKETAKSKAKQKVKEKEVAEGRQQSKAEKKASETSESSSSEAGGPNRFWAKAK